jgi:3-hydroxyisobutyrate dehydrogenase
MVTALCEATHVARRQGLDLAVFQAVLEAGPMASPVALTKLAKLRADDFAAQASVANVRLNCLLAQDAARAVQAAAPLLDACLALFTEAQAAGAGGADMVAVVRAIEARTASLKGHRARPTKGPSR